MSTTRHPATCRCGLQTQVTLSPLECYRQLAHAILGPAAPHDDLALARALAAHAQRPFGAIRRLHHPRVA